MRSLSRTIGHPPRGWLQKRVTVDDAEHSIREETATLGLRVSDRWMMEWDEFKSIINEDDELWQFEWFPVALSAWQATVSFATVAASLQSPRGAHDA